MPPVNHGVVGLAEEQAKEPIAVIRLDSEERFEEMEAQMCKQSKINGVTQLIAIIALSVAVLALIVR